MNADDLTDDAVIEKYISIRDFIAAKSKAFDELMKPYADGMKLLENLMLGRLNARKADNSTTEHGTAFRQTTNSVKCEDKDAFLDWCVANFDTYGKDMLTANVSKDTLNLYLADEKQSGLPPPGVVVLPIIKVIFRK